MDGTEREIFDRMAKAQEEIAAIMGKPKGRLQSALEYTTAGVGIAGIIAIIDIIRRWILGG